MKQFVIIILLLSCSLSYAQSIGPYFIGSQGAILENDEIKLYSTVGEPINSFERADDIAVSQGVLQSIQEVTGSSLELCTAKSGEIFFENCDDGTLFFFIRGDDGMIYDPYYGEGVEFEEEDSLRVIFGFRPADFATPCSIADQAIILSCVEAEDVTSSINILPESFLSVFPNPSIGNLAITLNENMTDATLKVVDRNGKDLYIQTLGDLAGNQKISLQLNDYAQGMYFLVLIAGEGILTKKIIIAK